MKCDGQKTHRLTNNEFTNTHAEGISLDGLCPVAAVTDDDEDEDDKGGGSGGGGIKHNENKLQWHIHIRNLQTCDIFNVYRIF